MKQQPRYQLGDKIGGRYQVHKTLMGGMGEVYLCLDLEQMHPFALKTFQQRYQSQALRPAFEKEVATWVALEKHPNIVRCFHMSILDNHPFMVLEWIAGEESKGTDLRSWLRHGPLDLQLALEIALDIVCGLQHVQQKQPGIVHRDLKPENILMAQGGLAKITDFGLAQIIASETRTVESAGLADQLGRQQSFVQHGHIVGTPAYMPPEQWRGEPLDGRSDIYALGCILYEIVTGQQPFIAGFTPTTPQQFNRWLREMQILHETEYLLTLANGLPTALADLVQSCLAKRPTGRPATLSHLLVQLTQLYQQQFDQSPPSRPRPNNFTASDYVNRGTTYHHLQKYKHALSDFDLALELKHDDPQAYSNRGNAYANLHLYEKAFADFGKALKLNPNYADAYNNRGTTYAALQQYKQALSDFEHAIKLDPNHAVAYSNRGLTYRDLHQYAQALTDFGRALKLNPNYADAYNNRGTTYAALQQYEKALSDFNCAIELDANHVLAYSNRGLTYHNLHQDMRAMRDFDYAIALDPNQALTYFNRGTVHSALQQYQQALADYNYAIVLEPNHVLAYYNRGGIYYNLQQYQEAFVDFAHVINLDSNYADAYYNRGNAHAALSQDDQALADFRQAIALNPEHAYAFLNIGVLLVNKGHPRAALPYLEKAAQLGQPQGAQYTALVQQMLSRRHQP